MSIQLMSPVKSELSVPLERCQGLCSNSTVTEKNKAHPSVKDPPCDSTSLAEASPLYRSM